MSEHASARIPREAAGPAQLYDPGSVQPTFNASTPDRDGLHKCLDCGQRRPLAEMKWVVVFVEPLDRGRRQILGVTFQLLCREPCEKTCPECRTPAAYGRFTPFGRLMVADCGCGRRLQRLLRYDACEECGEAMEAVSAHASCTEALFGTGEHCCPMKMVCAGGCRYWCERCGEAWAHDARSTFDWETKSFPAAVACPGCRTEQPTKLQLNGLPPEEWFRRYG